MLGEGDSEREHEDHLFGKLAAKSRRLDIEQVEAGFLKDGFLPEVKDDGVIESFVVNHDNQWSAQQVIFLFSRGGYVCVYMADSFSTTDMGL